LGRSLEDLGRSLEDLGRSLEDLGRSIEDLGRSIEDLGRLLEHLGRSLELLKATLSRADRGGAGGGDQIVKERAAVGTAQSVIAVIIYMYNNIVYGKSRSLRF